MKYLKNTLKGVGVFILASVIQIITLIVYCIVIFMKEALTSPTKEMYIDNIKKLTDSTSFVAYVSVFYALVIIILFGILYYKKSLKDSHLSIKELCKKDFSFLKKNQNIICLLCLIFTLEVFCNQFVLLIQAIFPNSLEIYQNILEASGVTDLKSAPMIIYVCLLGPLCEELIYRGAIFQYGIRTKNFWFANILQAFLFGLMHGNIVQFSYAFLLGLILGAIVYYSNTLVIVSLIHIGFNTYSLFLSDYILKLPIKEDSFLYYPGLIIMSLVFGVISFILTKQIVKNLKI